MKRLAAVLTALVVLCYGYTLLAAVLAHAAA